MNTTQQRIHVVINGDAHEIPSGRTVTELLTDLGLHPQLVVVEHNREILAREHYSKTAVNDGDALELVHFVGGG